MGLFDSHLEFIIIFLGALVGAIKSSTEYDKKKRFIPRLIDVLIGIFSGVALAYHFNNDSLALNGILALVGGVSGSIVVDVGMQMLPNLTQSILKRWFDQK